MLKRLRDLLAHARAGHRIGCETCAYVWGGLEADPKTVAALDRGIADMDAGRWYRYDPKTRQREPNPDWPKDGPQPGGELMSESQKHSDSAGSPVDAARRRGEM